MVKHYTMGNFITLSIFSYFTDNYSWHGDVKPSNILLVHNEFKLADFGFSEFEESTKGAKSQPEISMRGGTATYGEKYSILISPA